MVIRATGEKLPEPDLLLLSYTGCFTFMKWFEILREEYHCPVAMLHVPYQAQGQITEETPYAQAPDHLYTSSKIAARYSPRIPRKTSWVPLKIEIKMMMVVHPEGNER